MVITWRDWEQFHNISGTTDEFTNAEPALETDKNIMLGKNKLEIAVSTKAV
jgi:hypothetical protein